MSARTRLMRLLARDLCARFPARAGARPRVRVLGSEALAGALASAGCDLLRDGEPAAGAAEGDRAGRADGAADAAVVYRGPAAPAAAALRSGGLLVAVDPAGWLRAVARAPADHERTEELASAFLVDIGQARSRGPWPARLTFGTRWWA